MSTATYKTAANRILEELKKLDDPSWGNGITVGMTVRTENGDTRINFNINDVREVLTGAFPDYRSKFKIDDIVLLDPAGTGYGAVGKVVGVITYRETFGYIVSVYNKYNENLSRHYVDENELMLYEVNK